jgi:hypothetical protein
MTDKLPLQEYEVYQNGKMRRYTLLFAVNGVPSRFSNSQSSICGTVGSRCRSVIYA